MQKLAQVVCYAQDSALIGVFILRGIDIDYALCMYCGICVEVCPFDALFWSPEYEYSEYNMGAMLHDKNRLDDWLKTVPEVGGLEN